MQTNIPNEVSLLDSITVNDYNSKAIKCALNGYLSWLVIPSFRWGRSGYINLYPLGLTDCEPPDAPDTVVFFMFEALAYSSLKSEFDSTVRDVTGIEYADVLAEYKSRNWYFYRVNLLTPDNTGIVQPLAGGAYFSRIMPFIAHNWQLAKAYVESLSEESKTIMETLYVELYHLVKSKIEPINEEISRELANSNISIPFALAGAAPFIRLSSIGYDPATDILSLFVDQIGFCSRLQTVINGSIRHGTSIGIRGRGNLTCHSVSVASELTYELRIGADSTSLPSDVANKLNQVLNRNLKSFLHSIVLSKRQQLIEIVNGQ